MLTRMMLSSFILLLGGCASSGTKPVASHSYNSPVASSPSNIVHTKTHIQRKLYQHFNEWKGVPYQEGGSSKSGVDCSGFVHIAYRNKLNKSIARSTQLLSRSGHSIPASQLRTGDLVFFRTGWNKRHVGIYMGKGKFMHASSSRGVMMSKLDNPYWSEHYWMARRY